MTEREILLKKLSSVEFAMQEMRLFQDTHPDSKEAAQKVAELEREFVPLREQYEQTYGPLYARDATSPVQWINGPWPWEV